MGNFAPIERRASGAVYPLHNVATRPYGHSHNPEQERYVGIAVDIPTERLHRVYVTPEEVVKLFHGLVPGLEVTYTRPMPELPTEFGSVLVGENGKIALRDDRYWNISGGADFAPVIVAHERNAVGRLAEELGGSYRVERVGLGL